jgi:3-isopropylmalate/(R)-2-methylmalate dehydratase small subunit
MDKFIRVTGRAAAMPAANVDTDVIMPKAFLKGIDRSGLAHGLFHDLRFDEQGRRRPDFLLNRPDMADTRFLIVGPNFGCGSSREHAVWGMLQYGIRAIIGTSFAGIFADNAANNGLLLVTLSEDEIAPLMVMAEASPADLSIDLETQRIEAGSLSTRFDIDPGRRRALMLGLDRIGETLSHAARIRAFQEAYLAANPWLVEENPA